RGSAGRRHRRGVPLRRADRRAAAGRAHVPGHHPLHRPRRGAPRLNPHLTLTRSSATVAPAPWAGPRSRISLWTPANIGAGRPTAPRRPGHHRLHRHDPLDPLAAGPEDTAALRHLPPAGLRAGRRQDLHVHRRDHRSAKSVWVPVGSAWPGCSYRSFSTGTREAWRYLSRPTTMSEAATSTTRSSTRRTRQIG